MQPNEKIPILFVIFNRPELVRESMAAIRRYRPARLYIAADGPRPERPGEAALCEQARAAALEAVDWPCDVRTLFRDQNVGCGRGVSEAITWMLESEEYGAIVEDDCIVSPDFYRLCEDVLPRYKDDERVVEVSAFNPHGLGNVEESYFFSPYPGGCGWATWRRAWRHFDFEMKSWRAQRLQLFLHFNPLEALIRLWEGQKVYRSIKNNPKVWDFQWMLYVALERRLCILPCANLTQNIGMGDNATNTSTIYEPWVNVHIGALPCRLQHPSRVALNRYEAHRSSILFLRRYATLLARKIIKRNRTLKGCLSGESIKTKACKTKTTDECGNAKL
jgi:hypothetical protein